MACGMAQELRSLIGMLHPIFEQILKPFAPMQISHYNQCTILARNRHNEELLQTPEGQFAIWNTKTQGVSHGALKPASVRHALRHDFNIMTTHGAKWLFERQSDRF